MAHEETRGRRLPAGVLISVLFVVSLISVIFSLRVPESPSRDVVRPEPISLAGAEALEPEEAERLARASVERFLARHLRNVGRVARPADGGDTVAEGQGYALLMTALTDDEERFRLTWDWTRDNLLRDDGLFANRWVNGGVQDPDPAADANLDIAHALSIAAERFGDDGLRDDARAIAHAIAENEVADLEDGPLLLAGPWALELPPYEVNPSYMSPRAFEELSGAAPGLPWSEIRGTAYELVGRLTGKPPHLPPDWAVARSGGHVEPSTRPGTRGEARYGFDAVRVPLRHAIDCDERGRRLAARSWRFLRTEVEEEGLVPAYTLDGEPLEDGAHPAAFVGAAGAGRAAGDDGAVARLLEHAEELDREEPTYYGGALVALGRLFLTTDLLGGC